MKSLQYLQDMLFLEADEYLQHQINSQFADFEEDGRLRLNVNGLAYSTVQTAKQYLFHELRDANRNRFLQRFLADSAVSRRIKHEDAAKAHADEKPAIDISAMFSDTEESIDRLWDDDEDVDDLDEDLEENEENDGHESAPEQPVSPKPRRGRKPRQGR